MGQEAKKEAERLFQLLDDIDTADDMAKDNDHVYRTIVRKIQAKRWNGPIKTDGYKFEWQESV